MRVLTVVGITRSGKTTTIERIIEELKRRRYSVGSVKDIHYEGFAIDTEGTNTDRHYRAGSDLVTALGLYETDLLFKSRLEMAEILQFYDHDWVVLEGVQDYPVPRIVTAHDVEGIEEKLDDATFAISGRVADRMSSYCDLPVIDATREVERLVDLIEEKVFPPLPNLAEECCGACGASCAEMTAMILRGERSPSDCAVRVADDVKLHVDGRRIDMVPFVQRILRNAVLGVAGELEGFRPGARLDLRIEGDDASV